MIKAILKRIPRMSWILRIRRLPQGSRFTWGFIFFKPTEGVRVSWLLVITRFNKRFYCTWALKTGRITRANTKDNPLILSCSKENVDTLTNVKELLDDPEKKSIIESTISSLK